MSKIIVDTGLSNIKQGLKSPLPYFGGKSRIAKQLIDLIPPHKTYVEVFAGAAWVFFMKPASKYEIINDLDKNLITFYRVTKFHQEALIQELAGLQISRDIFYDLKERLKLSGLTDIQRAAYYFYVQKQAFAGRIRSASLATSANRALRLNQAVLKRQIPLVAERLKAAMIENLSWEKLIKLYDSPDTFFFLDPPYLGSDEYNHNFVLDDFLQLAACLKSIRGKFIMTHSETPKIRELFADFNVSELMVPYSNGANRVGAEMLITNFNSVS